MWVILDVGGSTPPLALVASQSEDSILNLSARSEFDDLRVIDTLPAWATLDHALDRALNASEAPLIAILGNPDLVFDGELAQRVCRAASTVTDPDRVAIVTGKGVDMWGNLYSGLYASLEPHLPYCRSTIPVVDSSSDLFIISRTHLAKLMKHPGRGAAASLPGWAVIEGYLAGRVSFFSPHLAAGISGHDLSRDAESHAETIRTLVGERVTKLRLPSLGGLLELGEAAPAPVAQRAWRLAPPIDLEKAIRDTILAHCVRMSLSIISRTQFKRPHLLRRMLTSITRWRQDEMDLEVVLSTDVDRTRAETEIQKLRADFPSLRLTLAWNGEREEQSRVRNLLGGLDIAGNDYVVFVDDDDHIHFQALSHLSLTRFMGTMPVLFMDTELRNEAWVEAGNGRWVLEETSFHHHYAGAGWRTIFQGSNQLPICAAILPRIWAAETTRRFAFRHDYSEDFALWLLLLEAPDLPLIVDIPRPFCVVSIRNDGTNTVTEKDRTRWVRDISLFLHDLHIARPLHGEGRLQTAVMAKASPGAKAQPTTNESTRLRREIEALRAENRRLRIVLARETDGNHSGPSSMPSSGTLQREKKRA